MKNLKKILKLAAFSIGIGFTGSAMAADFPFLDENAKPGDAMSTDSQPESWVIGATKDWMGKLPDNSTINAISIPGTHNSAALHGIIGCPNQSWSIKSQLEAGIRFLDIRVRRTGESFAVHHGACFQKMMFGDVVIVAREFLRKHPFAIFL